MKNFNIENYLQQIDESFKQKTQKDIYMIYIMSFTVIFALVYLLFWDAAENSYDNKLTQIEDVRKKIDDDRLYLQRNPESIIANLTAEIDRIKKDIVEVTKNNLYVKEKIESIPAIIYDEVTWGEFIDSISVSAKRHAVKLTEFTNKFTSQKDSFGHVLDITLQTEGSFKNMLNFIDSLEQSKLVVDIHHADFRATDKLVYDLNISVWGIVY